MARAPRTSSLLIVGLMIHLCLMQAQGYVVGEANSYPLGKLRATHLRFFHHESVGGSNATALRVAGVNVSSVPFPFTDLYVFDNPLRESADPASRVVGNAQGLWAFTGMDRIAVYMTGDFMFTSGKYNGSSISISSRNPITEARRELAVAGGRGRFRMAQGFASLTTRYFTTTGSIVEYNVTVLHY